MGKVTIRTSLTSQGYLVLSPWDGNANQYAILAISAGTNSISKLEIVSSLNSFNLARFNYLFNYTICTKKYNPKVYLGAIQTVANMWNYDSQNGQNWAQKSGSWLTCFMLFNTFI